LHRRFDLGNVFTLGNQGFCKNRKIGRKGQMAFLKSQYIFRAFEPATFKNSSYILEATNRSLMLWPLPNMGIQIIAGILLLGTIGVIIPSFLVLQSTLPVSLQDNLSQGETLAILVWAIVGYKSSFRIAFHRAQGKETPIQISVRELRLGRTAHAIKVETGQRSMGLTVIGTRGKLVSALKLAGQNSILPKDN
jgi:hypothetical protein